jgi:threonine dehydrogenase-like Zn-dependent dehydrogenase
MTLPQAVRARHLLSNPLRQYQDPLVRRYDAVLVLAALAAAAHGAAVPRATSAPTTPDYNAIIVGGGPAGLATLSGLARVRRNALLIDSGEYRNALTRYTYDMLGFDGNTDDEFDHMCVAHSSYITYH